MKSHGIFSDVYQEVGEIIVADVNHERIAELLAPDRAALRRLICKEDYKGDDRARLMLPTAASEPSRRHGHARIGIADRGRGGRCAAGTLDWTSQYAFLANRHRTRRQILGDA